MYKCFPQQMSSSGVGRETDNQRRRKQRRGQTTKEEGSKEGDRQPKKKEAKKGTDNQRRRKQRRGQTTKEEGSKEGDRQEGADVKQTNVFVYMYTVDGGCRLEVRNNKRATARVPDFISSFLLDGTCEGPM